MSLVRALKISPSMKCIYVICMHIRKYKLLLEPEKKKNRRTEYFVYLPFYAQSLTCTVLFSLYVLYLDLYQGSNNFKNQDNFHSIRGIKMTCKGKYLFI